ncbi:hypothetical protein D6C86_04410 [Aureobasidium pullulans]|nr:hypothetical protein D6C86_04410 [Aureobasidium pullulans]
MTLPQWQPHPSLVGPQRIHSSARTSSNLFEHPVLTDPPFRLLYKTHMVTIEVGHEKEHFVVHQTLICDKSRYFAKALSGSFQEGITRFVRLPDISPILFRIFVAWLYHGKLAYVATDAGIDEDFASLEFTEEDIEKTEIDQTDVSPPDDTGSNSVVSNDSETDCGTLRNTKSTFTVENPRVQTSSSTKPANNTVIPTDFKNDEENPESWALHVFTKLYVFAERFDIRQLRADALDGLATVMDKGQVLLGFGAIQYLYLNTTANSKLRTYIVHRTAYRCKFAEPASEYEKLPVEFLVAVLLTNGRRLTDKQCDECHQRALKLRGLLDFEHDDVCKTQDLAPYKLDMCFYHEHPDEEERKACAARRTTTE